ncbi:MAG: CAP domain-containing protein [Actinoplanes sp.]
MVVCATASALLLAGGVAATTAGAEENPDASGFSFYWPGFYDWPYFGDWSDYQDQDDNGWGHDRSDVAGDDFAAEPRRDAAPQRQHRPAAPAQVDQGHRNQAKPQRDRKAPAQRNAQAAPAAGAKQAKPGRQKAADTAQRDSGGSSSSLIMAARRQVTTADVSASPTAPIQQRILELINQNRRRGGCHAVKLDRRLIEAANEHASDMARRRYFAHESPNGARAGARVSEAGYKWKRYGENIARGADSAYEVVNGWMRSPSHRKNIMDCRLQQMGIGLAIGGGTPYWVQDFATPMR